MLPRRPAPATAFFRLFLLCLLLAAGGVRGQPKTDASEVTALNAIFSEWRTSSLKSSIKWNISGDPCSGAATNSTSLDDTDFNPGIKCNCSFSKGTVCHIIELKFVRLMSPEPVNLTEKLWSLNKLNRLLLQGNYFNGSLSPFIANMTALQHLNLSSNLFSGTIPKEIGILENLITLDLSVNSFSGSLPDELGKLINLQKLYLNSAGLSGQIPSSLASLVKLQTLWISDNNLTGEVPDFIGNFRDLSDLRMHGNLLQGPIPPSFHNLTKLVRLEIGEMVNDSSTLAFIEDMELLYILILRNSKISGSIPSDFRRYTHLEHLDLSFNNLTGPLPDSLFSLSSLKYLFLGNNSLSGTLPSNKSENLLTVDLSYNNLSGSFPAWVEKIDNINLVANNFKSNFPSSLPGLECLQYDVPCGRGSPNYSTFAINCGGAQPVTLQNGLLYESDEKSLGAASYFVSNGFKWAVSSVGRFPDVIAPSYTMNIGSRFSFTSNSELYQNARLSPSSLRYYGLGLKNGNYSIKLSFGETLDWDVKKGRRLFHIFIQGILAAKDFDITQRAGGQNLAAVEWNYTAAVTNNFLEIHLFWAGRGTCCIPTIDTYGPSLSALSITADFDTASITSSTTNRTPMIIGLVVATSIFLLLCLAGIFLWKRRRLDASKDEEFLDLAVKPNLFSYSELRAATGDFKSVNELGKGGFGSVYKGILSDGKEVAVKQLAISSVQGKRQFITEVATVSAVQHRNLVKLYGCCCEGNKRLLVYEYMANRSVDQALFGPMKIHIDWSSRFRICVGTARGLAYLHEESSIRVVHRDVKSSNILLDADLNPRISDFGLAKLYDENKTHMSTGVAGTVGYLAPEYAMRGQLTEKADVFGFGVVALEILCGRRNTEQGLGEEKIYLLEWAWHLHEEKRDLEMLDPTLSSYNEEEALRLISIAFMCTQAAPGRRPTMSRVVAILIGDMEVEEIVSKPSYLMSWKYTERDLSSTSVSQSTQYNSSSATQPLKEIEEGR